LHEKKRFGKWRPVYCRLTNEKVAISREQGGTITNEFPICMAILEPYSIAKKEFMQNRKSNLYPAASATSLTLFSSARLFIFSSTDQNALQTFYQAIRQMLQSALGESEHEARLEAARQLLPLLDRKMVEEINRAEKLVDELRKMGLMTAQAAFRKRGHLELQSQSNPNNWKRMFFLLKGNILYYRYDKHEAMNMLADPDVRRPGIVPLKLATLSTEQHEEQKQYLFIITTPYITYRCRAKHSVDCSEWLAALSKKAAGPALMPQAALADAGDTNISYKRPSLQYELDGKQRTYKIDRAAALIGRSKACDLCVKHDSISREHAKIEFVNERYCVLLDLGSTRGCRVNDQPVQRRILRAGDRVTLGKLNMQFQAE